MSRTDTNTFRVETSTGAVFFEQARNTQGGWRNLVQRVADRVGQTGNAADRRWNEDATAVTFARVGVTATFEQVNVL